MKCLCGYDYVRNINEEDNKGDENFIEITMSNDIEYQIYKGMGEYEKVTLKACPKCKTVKMFGWLD